MFDFEEFTTNLNKNGINITVTPIGGKIRLELYEEKTGVPVAIIREDNIERCFSRVIKNLINSKLILNNYLGNDGKLSIL